MHLKRLDCGCKDGPRTVGTMTRRGRHGYGHYAHDGDFLGACVMGDLGDQELNEFIDFADRRLRLAEEWWLDAFFEEAKSVGEELKRFREEQNACSDG